MKSYIPDMELFTAAAVVSGIYIVLSVHESKLNNKTSNKS